MDQRSNVMSRIPFILVTGFLGSGKTTFLKRLLARYSGDGKIGIIQNEFAPGSVDGTELKQSGMPFEILEVNNGSVFCVCLLGSFIKSLRTFVEEYQPEALILEASGLSDPISIGEIGGFRVRFHLYTVPGQIYYRSNRRLVLRGADSIVFVADSQRERFEANLESLRDLNINLAENEINANGLPLVFQYNKRDMPSAMCLDELERALNPSHVPSLEAVAKQGQGVFDTLRTICKLVVRTLH